MAHAARFDQKYVCTIIPLSPGFRSLPCVSQATTTTPLLPSSFLALVIKGEDRSTSLCSSKSPESFFSAAEIHHPIGMEHRRSIIIIERPPRRRGTRKRNVGVIFFSLSLSLSLSLFLSLLAPLSLLLPRGEGGSFPLPTRSLSHQRNREQLSKERDRETMVQMRGCNKTSEILRETQQKCLLLLLVSLCLCLPLSLALSVLPKRGFLYQQGLFLTEKRNRSRALEEEERNETMGNNKLEILLSETPSYISCFFKVS